MKIDGSSWSVLLFAGVIACTGEANDEPGGGSDGGKTAAGGSGAEPAAGGSGGAAAGSGGVGASAGAGAAGGSAGAAGGSGSGGASSSTLASQHPGDVGIENHPAVVFAENFEAGSVPAVLARYENYKNSAGMTLVSDVPSGSSGAASIRLRAGAGAEATDFYKRFDSGYERLFVRYYAKYEPGAAYHHTGVWFGGYHPAQNWPSPKAGLKPNGDDRLSVSFEPLGDEANPRMDFYNYWMTMHSGPNAYWGNTLIHREDLRASSGSWICVEIMLQLNPNPASPAGGELALWKDDTLIVHFTDASPLGWWTWDKFCPQNATGAECTNYPPDPGEPMLPLDLQWRSSTSLQLNYFWPQNYNTASTASDVWYDDVVVATERVGCLQ